jgi:hypothetical protein
VEDLDCDGAIEPRVPAFVHLAHATFAELRGDFVDAEARARGESQLLSIIRAWRVRERDYSCVTPQGFRRSSFLARIASGRDFSTYAEIF